MEQTHPLLVVPTAKGSETIKPILSLGQGTNVLITSLKQSRDGKAIIIRFFNPTDQPGNAEIIWGKVKPNAIYQSSPAEEKGSPVNKTISLSPWEVQTIRAELP